MRPIISFREPCFFARAVDIDSILATRCERLFWNTTKGQFGEDGGMLWGMRGGDGKGN